MINNTFQLLQTNQAKTLFKKYFYGKMKATSCRKEQNLDPR
jgi:hypothetical protein